ncbi:MAG: hypothetical protein AMXMBFR47_39360 [Planctomycetota bacterium]
MSDAPENLNPHDSFARRLSKALRKDGALKEPAPAPPAGPPEASKADEAPALFDSYAGRLESALKRPPRTTAEPAPESASPAAKNGALVAAPAAQPPAPSAAYSPIPAPAQALTPAPAPPQSEIAPGQPPADETAELFDSYSRRLSAVMRNSTTAQETAVTPAPPPPESQGPVGSGEHVVKPGECVSSIAKEAGHFWETIWNDPANAEIRTERKDPNVLLPDDKLHVPALREKWEPRPTEQRHRFRRRGEPAMLRLVLQVDNVPLANKAYTLEVDGNKYEGTTDAMGQLVQPISPNAKHGRLIVGEERWEFEIQLGYTDPGENLVGVQKRLANLGFYCGRIDGEWDDLCRSELRKFQKLHGLAETGEPDANTRETLKSVHGS